MGKVKKSKSQVGTVKTSLTIGGQNVVNPKNKKFTKLTVLPKNRYVL